ncbi:hypothetical protein GUJ93_ZPchr0013g36491 [Zizania palustris]|uniref:Magnesium transporter n=1 Tax=Zizania palustris TaxID=103762 RepID=A0A8J6BZZ1_ZIZPA|nr:hypothetical protein GUJ93_ZPchr0013g36491 [Zizania palustris]
MASVSSPYPSQAVLLLQQPLQLQLQLRHGGACLRYRRLQRREPDVVTPAGLSAGGRSGAGILLQLPALRAAEGKDGRIVTKDDDEEEVAAVEREDEDVRREEDKPGDYGAQEVAAARGSGRFAADYISLGIREPVYEVIQLKSNGRMSTKKISRRQLLKSSGLRLRDTRSVDPSLWLMNSMPSLLVREQAILVNLGSLRAIAMHERVLIFNYNSLGGKAFLESLLPRLNPRNINGGPAMIFQLEVVEAALLSRIQRMEQRLMHIEPRVAALLEVLPNWLTADVLEQLRLSKQALVELGSRAGDLKQMLIELLDDPHEIRRICIMGRNCTLDRLNDNMECSVPLEKQIAEEEEEEIEMLLENYLQRCESCHGQAERLLDSAREMEDSIAVNLRNIGMNLKSYLETNSWAFFATTGGIVVGAPRAVGGPRDSVCGAARPFERVRDCGSARPSPISPYPQRTSRGLASRDDPIPSRFSLHAYALGPPRRAPHRRSYFGMAACPAAATARIGATTVLAGSASLLPSSAFQAARPARGLTKARASGLRQVEGPIAETAYSSSSPAPTHKVTVHDRQHGVVHEFVVPQDQYILHTAEAQDITLPFACRHGCCTSCAVRIKSGQIRQPEALGISAELKDKGYALLCVGFPTSDVEVETQDEDEVYWLQFGRYFARGPVERDDYALELAMADE